MTPATFLAAREAARDAGPFATPTLAPSALAAHPVAPGEKRQVSYNHQNK